MTKNENKDRKPGKVWLGKKRTRRRRTILCLGFGLFSLGLAILSGTGGRFDLGILWLSMFGAFFALACFIMVYPVLEKHLSAIEALAGHTEAPMEQGVRNKKPRGRIALCFYGALIVAGLLSIPGTWLFHVGNMFGCYMCYVLAGHFMIIGGGGGILWSIELRLREVLGDRH